MVWSQQKLGHLSRFQSLLREWKNGHSDLETASIEYDNLFGELAVIKCSNDVDTVMTGTSIINGKLVKVASIAERYCTLLSAVTKKSYFLVAEIERTDASFLEADFRPELGIISWAGLYGAITSWNNMISFEHSRIATLRQNGTPFVKDFFHSLMQTTIDSKFATGFIRTISQKPYYHHLIQFINMRRGERLQQKPSLRDSYMEYFPTIVKSLSAILDCLNYPDRDVVCEAFIQMMAPHMSQGKVTQDDRHKKNDLISSDIPAGIFPGSNCEGESFENAKSIVVQDPICIQHNNPSSEIATLFPSE